MVLLDFMAFCIVFFCGRLSHLSSGNMLCKFFPSNIGFFLTRLKSLFYSLSMVAFGIITPLQASRLHSLESLLSRVDKGN